MSHRLLFQAAARSTGVMLRRSWMRHAAPTMSMHRTTNLMMNQPATQMRFFAKKGGFQKGSSYSQKGGSSKHQNKLTLQICFGPDQVEMDPDPDELIRGVNSNMRDIKKQVADNVGWDAEDIETLEYYENGEWKELKNPSQIEGQKQVAVRVPELFDEDEDYKDEDDYEGEDGDFNEDDEFNEDDMDYDDFVNRDVLHDTIKEFVKVLKEKGFAPGSKTAEGISISEWVLKQAASDKDLQKVLLSKPGALNHIVECLEYGFLWTDNDEEGEKEMGDANLSEQ